REMPVASPRPALDFAAGLQRGEYDWVFFLTGVGVRTLLEVLDQHGGREACLRALRSTQVAARGPKPAAALREAQVAVAATALEPWTWRELMHAVEGVVAPGAWRGLRVAVQEYGVPGPELASALAEKGSVVTRVALYREALPEDLEPLRRAIRAILDGGVRVALFTNAAQAAHLFQVA